MNVFIYACLSLSPIYCHTNKHIARSILWQSKKTPFIHQCLHSTHSFFLETAEKAVFDALAGSFIFTCREIFRETTERVWKEVFWAHIGDSHQQHHDGASASNAFTTCIFNRSVNKEYDYYIIFGIIENKYTNIPLTQKKKGGTVQINLKYTIPFIGD